MSYLLLFFLAVRVYCVRFFLTNSTFCGQIILADNFKIVAKTAKYK